MHASATRWIGALIRMSSAHPAMTRILEVIERLQDHPFRTNVVLLGEPGTGKEGLARALHHLMAPGTPLVRLDLIGFHDDEALEVVEGDARRKTLKTGEDGVAASAAGGMILIEEVAGLSLRVQTALLRLIKGGATARADSADVGPAVSRPRINVIALSDRDLSAEVAAGRFRHDLYFALARLVLTLPPLRERTQDLAPASIWIGNRVLRAAGRQTELMSAEEFARAPQRDGTAAIELHADAVRALARHPWPGNFRELEAVIERALMLYRTGPSLGAREIEAALADAPSRPD